MNDMEPFDQLDPTFLFVWSGTRTCDEPHYHSHDHIEIDFILSGKGTYYIDGIYYPVQTGDLIILNPGHKHQSLVSSLNDPVTEFFVGLTDIQFHHLPINHFPLAGNNFILHTKGSFQKELYRLCSAMKEENSICQQGRYYMLKSYVIQMLLLILRHQSAPIPAHDGCSFSSTSRQYVVSQILRYFEEHYSEKISLDQIAENMYLSPFYISKLFKSETGDTPIRHLINIRLERAKELLGTDPSLSIQEVASRVGYEDVYHFSKLFKKAYGLPPSKFKKDPTF